MSGKLSSLSTNTDGWRNVLAGIIFTISALSIVILALVVMTAKDVTVDVKRDIFNILVPVLTTWVATILAFYFARENFEAATRNAQQIVSQLTPEQKWQQTSVREAMVAKTEINAVTLGIDGDTTVLFSTILGRISAGASRVPIFAFDGSAKYVLHEGNVYNCLNKALLAVAGGAPPTTVKLTQPHATLADLLTETIDQKGVAVMIRDLAKRFAVVRTDANLAEARLAMLAVDGARDVFVTASAKVGEPVQGWLTDRVITRDVTVK